jgi:ribosomal protein S18 acetylase RimI-like enzyme
VECLHGDRCTIGIGYFAVSDGAQWPRVATQRPLRPQAKDEAMLDQIEQDTFGFLADFARRPGGTSGEEAGAAWFRSGVPLINYNGVTGVGADVDATLARVRAWGVPARWVVSSVNTPEAFEAELAGHGLTVHEDAPGMVARVEDLAEPRLGEATIEVVQSVAQSDEWVDVLRDGFGLAPETAACVRSAHGWPHMHNAGLLYLLVRLDGLGVATGLLRSATGVAGVYGIAVRRAFQRRGLGSLATLATVREGARGGARVAILQATQEGLPVYEKLGFQTLTTFRSWRIA